MAPHGTVFTLVDLHFRRPLARAVEAGNDKAALWSTLAAIASLPGHEYTFWGLQTGSDRRVLVLSSWASTRLQSADVSAAKEDAIEKPRELPLERLLDHLDKQSPTGLPEAMIYDFHSHRLSAYLGGLTEMICRLEFVAYPTSLGEADHQERFNDRITDLDSYACGLSMSQCQRVVVPRAAVRNGGPLPSFGLIIHHVPCPPGVSRPWSRAWSNFRGFRAVAGRRSCGYHCPIHAEYAEFGPGSWGSNSLQVEFKRYSVPHQALQLKVENVKGENPATQALHGYEDGEKDRGEADWIVVNNGMLADEKA